MGRVLLGVGLLALLMGISGALRGLRPFVRVFRFQIAGSFRALILWRYVKGFAHLLLRFRIR